MPSPMDIPRRPKWRYEPVMMVGRQIVPALFNEADRSRIDERKYSKIHETKDPKSDRNAN